MLRFEPKRRRAALAAALQTARRDVTAMECAGRALATTALWMGRQVSYHSKQEPKVFFVCCGQECPRYAATSQSCVALRLPPHSKVRDAMLRLWSAPAERYRRRRF